MSHNLVNEEISGPKVRITEDKTSRIASISDALSEAHELGMDLIQINESDMPICIIADYGKFRYEATKKAKEQLKKSKQSQISTKEVQLRVVTEKHDVEIKSRKIKEFLAAGHRVRIVIKFRGRELEHQTLGKNLVQTILGLIGPCTIDKDVSLSDRDMVTIVSPAKKG